MTSAVSAALAIVLYLLGGVAFAYVGTLIAMRTPNWGCPNYWNPGSVMAISIFWPLAIFIFAPLAGVVLAQRGREKARLRADEVRRLKAEVFGR